MSDTVISPSDSLQMKVTDSKGNIVFQRDAAGNVIIDTGSETDAYPNGAYVSGKPGTGPSDRYP